MIYEDSRRLKYESCRASKKTGELPREMQSDLPIEPFLSVFLGSKVLPPLLLKLAIVSVAIASDNHNRQ